MSVTTTYQFYKGCSILANEPSIPHPVVFDKSSGPNNLYATSENRVILMDERGGADLSNKYISGARLLLRVAINASANVPYFRAAAMKSPVNAETATWNNTQRLDATASADGYITIDSNQYAQLYFSAIDAQRIIDYGIQIFTSDAIHDCYVGVLPSIYDYFYTVKLEVEYLDSEPLTTAFPRYPVGSILNGGSESTFAWEVSNEVGTAQSRFDLQISANGTVWEDAATEYTDRTSYTFAAKHFSAGTHYWRVRSYNQSGVAGEWSDAAKFIVVSPPEQPIVMIVNAVPKFELSWTQSGQQGYEIDLDGVIIASHFGRESRYQYPEWAEPGEHIVRVRIQNEYSMWSAWGSAVLNIVNVPGTAIMLTAAALKTTDVALSWSGNSDRYIVYRNGALVGTTTKKQFTDHFAAGACTYQVRGVSDTDGYYTISEAVTVVVTPKNLMLYGIAQKAYVDLALSEFQSRTIDETLSRAVSYLHFAGTEKPSVEFGEDLDRSVAFDCAFLLTDPAYRAKFEAANGGIVCLKLPDGSSIVGAMATYTRKYTDFYVSYQSKVTETEFDEVASNG